MGEGGRRHLRGGRPGRRPKLEPAGRSPVVLQACARARIAPSTKPRAGQRAARRRASSYPPPARRRSRSPCQAEAGEAASRTPPGSQAPRAPAMRPRRPALCCLPQLRGRGAARAEVLRASPIRPGGQFLCLLSPPTARPQLRHPSRGLAAGRAQSLLSAPKGPAAWAAPEPGTRPSWEGPSGPGIHSPSPATSHPAVGEGAASPPFHRAPGPVRVMRLGRVPAPNALRQPGKKCWAGPGPAPRAPHPREPAPGLAGRCRSPSAVRPPARGRGGGKPQRLAAISRPGAPPPARSLTCQLSSQ